MTTPVTTPPSSSSSLGIGQDGPDGIIPQQLSGEGSIGIAVALCLSFITVFACVAMYLRGRLKPKAGDSAVAQIQSLDDSVKVDEFGEWRSRRSGYGTPGFEAQDVCVICIVMLEVTDKVRGLGCGHAFHQLCLDEWFIRGNYSCPLCKGVYYKEKVDNGSLV